MADASYQVLLVPPDATAITTPLHHYNWHELLSTYPDQALVHLFITGLINDFRVGFNKPISQLRSAHRNLIGALQYPQVVDDYLKAEITEHCIVDSFHKKDILAAHVSRSASS